MKPNARLRNELWGHSGSTVAPAHNRRRKVKIDRHPVGLSKRKKGKPS